MGTAHCPLSPILKQLARRGVGRRFPGQRANRRTSVDRGRDGADQHGSARAGRDGYPPPIALEGIYRWVAFLPSRMDERVPVANRYFGVFRDGSFKVRGIEARRHDTPPFIAAAQLRLLETLAAADGPPADQLPAAVALLRDWLADLRAGRVAPVSYTHLDVYKRQLPFEAVLLAMLLEQGRELERLRDLIEE